MLKTRSKSGMAPLRYTMLAVICTILGLTGITQAYDYRYALNNSKYAQIIDNDRVISTQGAVNWSNYSWSIDNIGNIITTYNGDSSDGIFLPINDSYNQLRNTLSVFWNNDKLYYYSKDYMQGYFQYFCTGNINSTSFANCLSTNNGGIIDYNNYQSYITSGTLQPIEIFNNNEQYHNNIVAFFYVDSNAQGNYNASEPPFGFIYNDNTFVAFPIINKANINTTDPNNGYNLTGTLEINYEQPMSFTKFQGMDNLKEEAPTINGGEEIPQPTGYDPETGLPCATINTLIKYESNFNTGMCYSSTYIFSGGQIQTITPKTFTELRTGYNRFRNDLNKYRNYCTPPATSTACANAFQNEDEKRSLINSIPEERLTDGGKTLYDYCHMYLTYSGDTNICDIPEEELRSATYEDLINRLNEITVTQPGSGSVYDNYKNENNRDILAAIPSVYSKITGIFRNNTGVQGIIPGYITRIIVITVLFVLFKK